MIPTYNEYENVELLYAKIRKLNIKSDILFIDDGSPDGTGQLIDTLVAKDKKCKVIHRSGKLGIGSAHLVGIEYAYAHNYHWLLTMDCDFSHPPEFIPALIAKGGQFDVVVGSRYLQKDSLSEWSLFRKSLTYIAHALTYFFLGVKHDASSAFRLYDLQRIPRKIFGLIESKSYSFFFESLFILTFNRMSVGEISIFLPKRIYGHSKITFKDIWTSLALLNTLFWRKILRSGTLKVQ